MELNRIAIYLGIVTLCGISVLSTPLELIYRRQLKLLIKCIETLNKFHEFDNIIIYRTPDKIYEAPTRKGLLTKDHAYIDKSVGDLITHYLFTRRLQKLIMTFSIEPSTYNGNKTDGIPNLGRFLTNRNLAIVVLNDLGDTNVKEFVARSLGGSLKTKLVFLLIGQEISDTSRIIRVDKLNDFFLWCWSKNILNVILLFQKYGVENIRTLTLEVFTYTPFPKPIDLIRLTHKHPREYFVDRTSDIMGYEFKTPVFPDKPRVFKAYNPRLGTHIVTGIAGHLYVAFVKRINGTFTELPRGTNNFFTYQSDLLNSRNIDMGIHPFSYNIPNHHHGSYPITNTNSCVVVPVIPEIFPGLYIPRTLNLSMWCLLLLTFLVFQVTYIAVDKLTYGQWTIWHATSVTLQGILNMPLGNINRAIAFTRLSSRPKLVIHMLLTLTGMIYSQVHIAALTSYLSTTLYGRQLETMEDLQNANVSIMMINFLFNAYKYLNIIPAEYASSVLITDADTVSKHMNSLNTSYAYIVYNEEWKIMQNLQRNLWKPRFKVASNLCIPNVYLSLPMQFNSPFYHTLKNFILTVQETGLEQKWRENLLWDIRQTTSGRIPLTENREHPTPLTLAHFTAMWWVYAIGITLALVVFVGERILNSKQIK